jgi:hypothetical protein
MEPTVEPHRLLTIADRGPLLRNLGEALEKVLTRHHADLKRVFTPPEEESQLTATLDQQALTHLKALSQAEQLRQARRAQREAVFMRVQALSAQGWSGASIARMLGIQKKTAGKYAAAEHFPQRRDRGHKLAPYLPFLQTQWTAGEHNIAALSQAIYAQGDSGEVNLCAAVTSLHCERKSDQQDDRDDTIRPSLQRGKESLAGPFRVVKRPG